MDFKKKALVIIATAGVFSTWQVVAQDVQSGVKDLESGRYEKAIQTFQGLANSVASPENFFHLGWAQLKSGNPDAAKESFTKGTGLDPKNQLNKIGLAAVALAKKDALTAKTLIDNALKETKNKNIEVMLRAGEAYILFPNKEKGISDPAAAIAILEEANKRDKKNENVEIEMALGDAYSLKNDGGNAVSNYENALTIQPNNAEAKYKIGNVYLRGKNYAEAQKFYGEAIAADPEYALTYEDLAEAFFGSRAYKNASKNMDLYLQKSQTTDVDKVLRSAQFDFLASDYQRAIRKLDQLKGKVKTPIIHRIYGWAYSGSGKYQEAIDALNTFIQQAPDKVIYDDYKYLGRAYSQLGTSEGDSLSLINLEKAAPQDTTENLYNEVGRKYFSVKQYDKAVNAYKKAIAKDTAKATASDYSQLGYSYFFMGNRIGKDSTMMMNGDTAAQRQAKATMFAAADSAFMKVNAISPEWAPAYYWRAQSNYFMYPREEAMQNGVAIPLYEKYLEMADKEIVTDASKKETYKKNMMTTYKFLSSYYASKNDLTKSHGYLTKAAELDPADTDVQRALNPPAPKSPQAPKSVGKPITKKPGKTTK